MKESALVGQLGGDLLLLCSTEEVGQLLEVDQGTQVHVVEAGVGSPHNLS